MRLLFLFVLGLLVTSPFLAAAEKRPNVLWIIAEDFSPDLACYGAKQVNSPNLDRLAARGMRFTRAFTTAPVCSPSRSAFMTGMYQTTLGAHNHRSHRDDGYKVPEGVQVLPDWLRQAGYYTANAGSFPKEQGLKVPARRTGISPMRARALIPTTGRI